MSALVLLAVVAAAATFGGTGCAPAGGDGSPTLVKVGSRRISVSDYESYARDPQVMGPYASLPDSVAKRTLLDDLLSYELFAEAATRQGLDKDSAYAKVEETLLPRLLPDALYDAKIGSLVKASDDEARLFYEKQKDEYQLAVIMTNDSLAMHSLIKRLEKGESFEDVARTGSQDPTTSGDGGKIAGWLTLGQLPPDVETLVAPLAKGQRTGIVPQRTGMYLFEVVDKRARKDVPPFDEVKASTVAQLEQRKRGAIVDKYLTGLRASHQLVIAGPGWDVVQARFLGFSDSLASLAVANPSAAGLTAEQQGAVLATWKDHKYTVADMLGDIRKAEPMERPPLTRDDAVRMFVEGHAMNEILVAEAKIQKLDQSDKVRRQVTRARSAYLVNRYIEKNLSGAAVGTPTMAELDSITAALVRGMGAAMGGHVPTFAELPPQIQQQIASDWSTKKRQALLKTEVERLKAEIKPVVDEKAFARIPWPVPAAGA